MAVGDRYVASIWVINIDCRSANFRFLGPNCLVRGVMCAFGLIRDVFVLALAIATIGFTPRRGQKLVFQPVP